MQLRASSDTRSVPFILLAEHDAELRCPRALALETDGYRVLQAGTGVALLGEMRCIKPFGSRSGVVDLLIADMHLPDMNGLAALRRLRDAGFCVPAILISATIEPDYVRAETQGQGAMLLMEPVDVRALRIAVRQALAWPRYAPRFVRNAPVAAVAVDPEASDERPR